MRSSSHLRWTLPIAVAFITVAGSVHAQDGRPSFNWTSTGTDRVEARVVLPTITVDEPGTDGRATWRIHGETRTMAPGRPEIPYIARLLMLDASKVRVHVLDQQLETVQWVAPALSRPRSAERGLAAGGPVAPVSEGDRLAFVRGADGFAPARLAMVEAIGTLNGQALTRLVLYPVQFDLEGRKTRVATAMTVVLEGPGVSSMTRPTAHERPRALFVVGTGLEDAVAPLIDWRRRTGWLIETVEFRAGDEPEALSAYIREQMATRPDVVVLVGDSDNIPALASADNTASDWFYGNFDGDLAGDAAVSRLAGADPAEIRVQVEKIIEYEHMPAGTAWPGRAVFVSSSLAEDGPSDDDRCSAMAAFLEDAGSTGIDFFYHSTGTDTVENIAGAFAHGRGLVSYLGHGDVTSWTTTQPPFTVDDAQNLQNGRMTPLILDISCKNGRFDDGESLAEAFMESGLPGDPAGAVGVLASSTVMPWDEPAEMALGIVEALAGGARTWGSAVTAGSLRLIETFGVTNDVTRVIESFIVFGDAAMIPRVKAPIELTIVGPAVVKAGTDAHEFVALSGGTPVADVMIALTGMGIDEVGWTDGTGKVRLAATATQSGALNLVATAPGHSAIDREVTVVVPTCGQVGVMPTTVACEGGCDIVVWDSGLDIDPDGRDLAIVDVVDGDWTSTVSLREYGNSSGVFSASFVAHGNGSRVISVSATDQDCDGTVNVDRADLRVDCDGPKIEGVGIFAIDNNTAKVVVAENETANVCLRLLADANSPPRSFCAGPDHRQTFVIGDLNAASKYPFSLSAVDVYGNQTEAEDSSWVIVTPPCLPNCSGLECGPDGCGGYCGTCVDPCSGELTPQLCVMGQCATPCCPNCADRECGDDDCGGSCGFCVNKCTGELSDSLCNDHHCQNACCPQCDGRECGPDGCGTLCGRCADDQYCSADGHCVGGTASDTGSSAETFSDTAGPADSGLDGFFTDSPDSEVAGGPDVAAPRDSGCSAGGPARKAKPPLFPIAFLLALVNFSVIRRLFRNGGR